MGYRDLVQRQVRLAFKKVKDLAKVVTLRTQTITGFNFATSTSNSNAVTTLDIKVVELTTKKNRSKEKETTTLKKELLLIEEDIPNLDNYSTVEVDGVIWNVVRPIESDGYTTVITATREA